ncbi:MAG: cadherin-like domain-containing protein [Methylotenera sp.]|nr:cadherin-like domain-containing protein [Oligoflexia bacterium]
MKVQKSVSTAMMALVAVTSVSSTACSPRSEFQKIRSSSLGLQSSSSTLPGSGSPTSGGDNSSGSGPGSGTALPPVAQDDGPFETAELVPLKIENSQLLNNDSDPASSALRVTGFKDLTSGSLVMDATSLTFTPADHFSGQVTFTYTVKNAANLAATATATINVRKAAVEVAYANSSDTLYHYDPVTHTNSRIGGFTIDGASAGSVYDIAITSTGLMYAIMGGTLYYVDASTAAMTLVTSTGFSKFGNIAGLTALSDGRIVLGGNGLGLFDIATGELTTLIEPGHYQTSGDVIALPDGNLYWSVFGNGGYNHLIRVDPATKAMTDVGALAGGDIYGLGYANGHLYGFSGSGDVWTIDPATGHSVNAGHTPGAMWYGATTNPVRW